MKNSDLAPDIAWKVPLSISIDPCVCCMFQNHEGESALLCGAQYGHTEVVNVLLEVRLIQFCVMVGIFSIERLGRGDSSKV